ILCYFTPTSDPKLLFLISHSIFYFNLHSYCRYFVRRHRLWPTASPSPFFLGRKGIFLLSLCLLPVQYPTGMLDSIEGEETTNFVGGFARIDNSMYQSPCSGTWP